MRLSLPWTTSNIWLNEADSRQLAPEKAAAVRWEMADVLLYLVRLADQLGVDLPAAAREKIALNAQKYPAAKARGSMKKYTELFRQSLRSPSGNPLRRHNGLRPLISRTSSMMMPTTNKM